MFKVGPKGRSIAWNKELEIDVDALRLSEGHPEKPDGTRELSRTEPTITPVTTAIARAIEASGLTQKQPEERTGISQPNISRILRPDYDGHNIHTLEPIAEALGKKLVMRFE